MEYSVAEDTSGAPEEPERSLPATVVLYYANKGIKLSSIRPFQEFIFSEGSPVFRKLLVMPTGYGKTMIADLASQHFLSKGKKVLFCVPFLQLMHEQYVEAKKKWPKIAGLTNREGRQYYSVKNFPKGTSDMKISNSDIIFCTFERARGVVTKVGKKSKKGGAKINMKDIGLIVLDEIHLINDSNRGTAVDWLVTMSKMHDIPILGMTGTLEYPGAIRLARYMRADLSYTKKRSNNLPIRILFTNCNVFKDKYVSCGSTKFNNVWKLRYYKDGNVIRDCLNGDNKVEIRDIEEICFEGGDEDVNCNWLIPLMTNNNKKPPCPLINHSWRNGEVILKTIIENEINKEIPGAAPFSNGVLVYVTNKWTIKNLVDPSNDDSKSERWMKVRPTLPFVACDEETQKKRNEASAIKGISRANSELFRMGIAVHHADVASLKERELIINLYEKKVIRVIYCTSTLSAGINLSNLTLVLVMDTWRKIGAPVEMNEIIQTCGRAGRTPGYPGESWIFYSLDTGLRMRDYYKNEEKYKVDRIMNPDDDSYELDEDMEDINKMIEIVDKSGESDVFEFNGDYTDFVDPDRMFTEDPRTGILADKAYMVLWFLRRKYLEKVNSYDGFGNPSDQEIKMEFLKERTTKFREEKALLEVRENKGYSLIRDISTRPFVKHYGQPASYSKKVDESTERGKAYNIFDETLLRDFYYEQKEASFFRNNYFNTSFNWLQAKKPPFIRGHLENYLAKVSRDEQAARKYEEESKSPGLFPRISNNNNNNINNYAPSLRTKPRGDLEEVSEEELNVNFWNARKIITTEYLFSFIANFAIPILISMKCEDAYMPIVSMNNTLHTSICELMEIFDQTFEQVVQKFGLSKERDKIIMRMYRKDLIVLIPKDLTISLSTKGRMVARTGLTPTQVDALKMVLENYERDSHRTLSNKPDIVFCWTCCMFMYEQAKKVYNAVRINYARTLLSEGFDRDDLDMTIVNEFSKFIQRNIRGINEIRVTSEIISAFLVSDGFLASGVDYSPLAVLKRLYSSARGQDNVLVNTANKTIDHDSMHIMSFFKCSVSKAKDHDRRNETDMNCIALFLFVWKIFKNGVDDQISELFDTEDYVLVLEVKDKFMEQAQVMQDFFENASDIFPNSEQIVNLASLVSGNRRYKKAFKKQMDIRNEKFSKFLIRCGVPYASDIALAIRAFITRRNGGKINDPEMEPYFFRQYLKHQELSSSFLTHEFSLQSIFKNDQALLNKQMDNIVRAINMMLTEPGDDDDDEAPDDGFGDEDDSSGFYYYPGNKTAAGQISHNKPERAEYVFATPYKP